MPFPLPLLLSLMLAPAPQAAPREPLRLEPYPLETSAGSVQAQIGRLRVPERRSAPGSRAITLAIVRIPSTAKNPGAPVVYLDGGPGGSGVGAARVPELWAVFSALRASSDVILLSQRGTGLSDRIGCRGGTPLPEDTFASLSRMREEFTARQRSCAESLRAQGVDLAGYTTEESADDVDALRQALGVPRVSLLGFSYGTHLALSTLKRHGDRIERVVLIGVEGPDDTLKFPAVYDRQVDAIEAHLKQDARTRTAMPDFAAALRRLVAATRTAPLRVNATIGGTARSFLIGADGLLSLLRRDIGDTNDFPWIPAFVYDTAAGNLTMLQRLIERRIPGLESGINMMATAMDCSSGAGDDRMAEIKRQEPGSIFGPLTNFPYPDVCAAAGIQQLDDAFRAPVASRVPALFVSGTFDSNTPPAQAERIMSGFTDASHLVVRNAGHESTVTKAVQDRIVAFMSGQNVASEQLEGARIQFNLPKK